VTVSSFAALIDTGASRTCISPAVVAKPGSPTYRDAPYGVSDSNRAVVVQFGKRPLEFRTRRWHNGSMSG